LGTACCCALSHVSSNARLYGETDTSSVASTSLNSKLWRGDENEEDPVVTIAVASNVQRCDFLHSIFVFSKEAQHGGCVTSCPSSEREREREGREEKCNTRARFLFRNSKSRRVDYQARHRQVFKSFEKKYTSPLLRRKNEETVDASRAWVATGAFCEGRQIGIWIFVRSHNICVRV
jgi:hypothetical protein